MGERGNGEAEPRKFGWFGGVFTPCTLTILGVIMFLRLGHVVGQSGVWAGLGIVLLAKLITTLTAFSLSAVATNTRLRRPPHNAMRPLADATAEDIAAQPLRSRHLDQQ